MNYKKLGVFLILGCLLLTTTLALVSAATTEDDIQGVLDKVNEIGRPIFKWIFGTAETGEQLAIQILAFLLVLIIVYGTLSTVEIFGDKKWINTGLGLLIAIIGIRFLPPGLLDILAAPSSAFVATMFVGIPFVLLFFVMQRLPSGVRRAVWAVYGAILLVIVVNSWWKASRVVEDWYWVYMIIAVACFLAFWFDGTIQKWWSAGRGKRVVEASSETEIDIIDLQLQYLRVEHARLLAAGDNLNAGKTMTRIKRLEKARDVL